MQAAGKKRKSGQTMVFILMVLVILTFVVLYNFDLHKIMHTKYMAQNAGDSAAVMASRWQAITLNIIGDLNIMNAAALSIGETETSKSINDIQARLCFVGPMTGLYASQQAAKQNGIYVNDEFTEEMRAHADVVRYDYSNEVDEITGEMLFNPPYTNCWQEYADMIQAVAETRVAAAPDNAVYYSDNVGGHMLYRYDFYSAIAGRDWCWFYHNAPTLLDDYTNYEYWDPLPPILSSTPMNCEFYGLQLTKQETSINSLDGGSQDIFNHMTDIADEHGLDPPTTNMLDITATWYCFDNDTNAWSTSWDRISGGSGEDRFPAIGRVQPQYEYQGPDAVVRITATELTLLTPDATPDSIVWTAAAKPFGSLNNEQDPPNIFEIVLPAFHHARLIALDASSAPLGGSYNIAWRKHLGEHLPYYMQYGPHWIDDYERYAPDIGSDPSSCSFCNNLVTWEPNGTNEFRATGSAWLSVNSYLCTISPLGGSGGPGSGGTSRGH